MRRQKAGGKGLGKSESPRGEEEEEEALLSGDTSASSTASFSPSLSAVPSPLPRPGLLTAAPEPDVKIAKREKEGKKWRKERKKKRKKNARVAAERGGSFNNSSFACRLLVPWIRSVCRRGRACPSLFFFSFPPRALLFAHEAPRRRRGLPQNPRAVTFVDI